MKTNILRSLIMMIVVMALCMTQSSCKKEDIKIDMYGCPTLEVDKYYLNFELGEISKEIKVSSQEEWVYTVDEDWVHVTRKGNSNRLTVLVDENRNREIRECILTINVAGDSQKKISIIITQQTSLITLSCNETELNFSSHEGAYNILSVKSNGDWMVRSTPEWLRASVSSGKGNKSISFTTLSTNKTSGNRTGTIVIGTIDEEIQIPVKQYGGVVANCQVTPKNITVLSNGIAFDMDYSRGGNVAHYYRGYMEASRVGSMTNPEIISTLQREFQRHLPADDEVADFSDLKPNTSYIIYTLAYDMEGKMGDLLSTEVKTRKEDINEPCGWISNVQCTDSYWEWSITMSATCYSYWMMTTEDYAVANASDVLQAWWIEDAIRHNKLTEYFNGGNWRQIRKGNMIAVWTRGMNVNGTWAGKIMWGGYGFTSSSMIKQYSGSDHSGRKLPPEQYQLYRIK